MTETKKPALIFTLFCDDIRQEVGGKISLMGLFEHIYATQFPVAHPRLVIIQEWAEGRGEHEARTVLLSPDRKTELRETFSTISLNDTNFRQRDISVHLNLEFPVPGTYWLETFLDNELICSIPLKIVLVKEPSFH